MLILRDPVAVAGLVDAGLRHLIQTRIQELATFDSYDPEELGYFIVAEPGDLVADLEREAGCLILSCLFTGARYGEEGFSPNFEWVEEHAGFYEMVFILSDGGFGIDLFIPKQAGMDSRLLSMCAAYVTPPPSPTPAVDL